jgi:crotonobetainyl-CoA:carnitine CoA-transferase CaiB-like acyl-CoA transferase
MGALDGLRVIDFGQYIAGPLAAVMLADQGAEVIHVDPPGGPAWKTDADAFLQRGKRRISLDLKSASDLAIARRLIGSAASPAQARNRRIGTGHGRSIRP